MEIKIMQLGPLGTNCYIIYKEAYALIVDPGGEAENVASFLESMDLRPVGILLTHAHFDHIGAVEELRHKYSLDVYLHEQEKEWLGNPHLNRSIMMGGEIKGSAPDYFLTPGAKRIGIFEFQVLHTPGHSPGSTSLVFHDEGMVLSGDALFKRGVGRTDLPGGDFTQLAKSIRDELYKLPDFYKVYPGHGPETSIGEEKKENPFIPAI